MNALAPYLAAIHQQNLLEQAELDRLVRQVRQSRSPEAGVAAWRRRLGAGARRLSAVFATAARSLDPTVEAEHIAPRGAERPVGRVLAC
jgi:hypothetical protein